MIYSLNTKSIVGIFNNNQFIFILEDLLTFAYNFYLIMKPFFILLLIFISSNTYYAQDISLLTANTLGNGEGKNDEVNALTTDAAGNLYVYGTYQGLVDFSPGASRNLGNADGNSDADLYLAKYNSNDSLLWVISINTASNGCTASDLILDQNGDILICGSFTNWMQPDPSNTQYQIFSNVFNESNGFILKYSGATGQFIWVLNLGGSDTDNVLGLAVDNQNNVYASGGFSDTLDFDPGPATFNLVPTGIFQDPYLAKYDENGGFIWAKSFMGSSLPGNAFALEIGSDGNLTIAGTFSGTIDFDPSSANYNVTSNGGDDVFVAE